VLKAAFVQGRLAKDELDHRIGQVLVSRMYTDLNALIAEIPAGLTARQAAAPMPEPARVPSNKKLIARGTAGGATAIMVLAAALVMPKNPLLGLVAGVVLSSFTAVLIAGLLTFLSWALGKSSSTQGSPPSASGDPASADSTERHSPLRRDPPQTSEAVRPRPALPGNRPFGHRYALGG
jgi:hypothetical protein